MAYFHTSTWLDCQSCSWLYRTCLFARKQRHLDCWQRRRGTKRCRRLVSGSYTCRVAGYHFPVIDFVGLFTLPRLNQNEPSLQQFSSVHNNNNNNNSQMMFIMLSSWQAIARIHPFYLTNVDYVPSGRQPSDQVNNHLGLWVRLHPPSWIFKRWVILTAHTLRGAKMRHHTKFCADLSRRCEDMAVFDFSRWRTSAILDLLYACLDHPRSVFWWSLSLCKIWFESVQ